jgi:hypothetical protein
MELADLQRFAKSIDLTPNCSDHKLIAQEDTTQQGTIILLHCPTCHFTSYMHPDTYAQLTASRSNKA